MTEIDETIQKVENLYRSLAGREPPSADDPYSPIPPEVDAGRHVEEQLARLMAMLNNPSPMARGAQAAQASWVPPVTIWESPKEIVVQLEVAGVPREAISVSVSQGVLNVSGQRPARPPGEGEYRTRVVERPFGAFRRVIVLPQDIVVGQMAAEMRDGLLEIRVPRSPRQPANAESIPIK